MNEVQVTLWHCQSLGLNVMSRASHSTCQEKSTQVTPFVFVFVRKVTYVYYSSAVLWRRWNQKVTDSLTDWVTRSPIDPGLTAKKHSHVIHVIWENDKVWWLEYRLAQCWCFQQTTAHSSFLLCPTQSGQETILIMIKASWSGRTTVYPTGGLCHTYLSNQQSWSSS